MNMRTFEQENKQIGFNISNRINLARIYKNGFQKRNDLNHKENQLLLFQVTKIKLNKILNLITKHN